MNLKTPLVVPHLPMKDMDPTMLTLAIHEHMATMSAPDVLLMKNALSLAAYLHRKDTRLSTTRATNGEENQPTTPYIAHPLRNTLRLLRWGVTDAHVLAASILHDVVEDHPREIVREFTDAVVPRRNHEEMRKVALRYLATIFGAKVAYLVSKVSNPILPHNMDRDERNAQYLAHVKSGITDAGVFLVKSSDLVDNSLSLHHSFSKSDAQGLRRAAKYLPAMPVVLNELQRNYEAISIFMSPEGIKDLQKRFEKAEEYLQGFVNAG